jgi:hypothetical protein
MRWLVIVLVLASGGAADAMPDGGAYLHYELTGLHDSQNTKAAPEAEDLVLAGARLHGFIGGERLGYHVGIDRPRRSSCR